MSHIQKFGDARKSPVGDTGSPAGDAASPSRNAVVSHWRCIISFRDAHPPHSHPNLPQETPHLPREMWSHLQSAGYVTLLSLGGKFWDLNLNLGVAPQIRELFAFYCKYFSGHINGDLILFQLKLTLTPYHSPSPPKLSNSNSTRWTVPFTELKLRLSDSKSLISIIKFYKHLSFFCLVMILKQYFVLIVLVKRNRCIFIDF